METFDYVIVGAGSVVTQGRTMPAGHLVLGSPARPVRPLTEKEILAVRDGWASSYFHPFLDIEYLRQVVQGVAQEVHVAALPAGFVPHPG